MGLRVVTLKMTRSAVNLVDKMAKKYRASRSELIRAAVIYVIANNLVEDALRSYLENAKKLGVLRDDEEGVEVDTKRLILGGPVFIIDVDSRGGGDEARGEKNRGAGNRRD